ncbi:galactose-1-epimerase [Enterovibrio baiacu]|uniref:galactose-1-epimerase n=1 Tax=Enterovibrio baiacu TaxID=2491023 RepID=UPI003D11C427
MTTNEREAIQGVHSHIPSDGNSPNLYELTNANGMSIALMDIGATWVSCLVPVNGIKRDVILGCSSAEDYEKQTAYFGATVGRYANRIAKGQFSLEGETYSLSTNHGENTLHGGEAGFDKQRWHAESLSHNSVTFSLISPDGDQGFPGTLKLSVTYTLSDDNAVVIRYQGGCDKASPVNLTNHAYFNLSDTEDDCLSHRLRLNADHYVDVDENLIPTGTLIAVDGDDMDFRVSKVIGRDLMQSPTQRIAEGYDHAYLLNADTAEAREVAASLISPDRKVMMEVFTTKPGLQVYTGNFLAGEPSRSGQYKKHSGVALETGYLPDSPNQPSFPNSVLAKNAPYNHETTYKFTVMG